MIFYIFSCVKCTMSPILFPEFDRISFSSFFLCHKYMIVFFLLLNRFCYMRQIEDHLSGCKWFGTHFKMIVLFDHYYLTEVPTTIIDLIEDLNDSLYLVLFCIAFKSNSSPTFLCELCEILIHFHDKRNHIS